MPVSFSYLSVLLFSYICLHVFYLWPWSVFICVLSMLVFDVLAFYPIARSLSRRAFSVIFFYFLRNGIRQAGLQSFKKPLQWHCMLLPSTQLIWTPSREEHSLQEKKEWNTVTIALDVFMRSQEIWGIMLSAENGSSTAAAHIRGWKEFH